MRTSKAPVKSNDATDEVAEEDRAIISLLLGAAAAAAAPTAEPLRRTIEPHIRNMTRVY